MRAEWPALKARCVSAVVPFCQSNVVFVSLALKIHFSVLHWLASVLLPMPRFWGPFCCLLLWSCSSADLSLPETSTCTRNSSQARECLFRRSLLPVCRVSFLLWQRQQRCKFCLPKKKPLHVRSFQTAADLTYPGTLVWLEPTQLWVEGLNIILEYYAVAHFFACDKPWGYVDELDISDCFVYCSWSPVSGSLLGLASAKFCTTHVCVPPCL